MGTVGIQVAAADFSDVASEKVLNNALLTALRGYESKGLKHFVDADAAALRWSTTQRVTSMRESVGGKVLTATAAKAPFSQAVGGTFSSHKALEFGFIEESDLTFDDYTFTDSFTVVQVVRPSSTSLAGSNDRYVWSAFRSNGSIIWGAWIKAGPKFSLQQFETVGLEWTLGGAMAAGTPAIIAFTAHHSSKVIKIFKDDPATAKASTTSGSVFPTDDVLRWCIGGRRNSTHGSWAGNIAATAIFDRDLSQGAEGTTLRDLFVLLNTQYALGLTIP